MSDAKSTKVTLLANLSPNSKFTGRVGGGCQELEAWTVTLIDSTSVRTNFVELDTSTYQGKQKPGSFQKERRLCSEREAVR